jgi:hypothetical protein
VQFLDNETPVLRLSHFKKMTPKTTQTSVFRSKTGILLTHTNGFVPIVGLNKKKSRPAQKAKRDLIF